MYCFRSRDEIIINYFIPMCTENIEVKSRDHKILILMTVQYILHYKLVFIFTNN